ncbi:MAG: bacillithiol biosynthesis cysteine-adding enzyme BshC [Ferruginibacter sp.]
MDCTASFLAYAQTGYFSKIVLDYIKQDPMIQPFYSHPVSIDGVEAAIADRKKFPTDRKLLVNVLQKQYASVETSEPVAKNLDLLQHENTFTICTAHQPNIFTGPLYFIYKILHVIKLAEQLKAQLPDNNFIPVYYMGSEDADLEELGHIHINGERHEWKTTQAGAVGRMNVDKGLIKLLDTISGQLLVQPFGAEIVGLMKECYQEGVTIEQATFRLVNKLFADYGLVILLPDNAELKAAYIPVIEKELTSGFSHGKVQETIAAFPADYKVQASGRELNMFYLSDGRRDRIEQENNEWLVVNTTLKFTQEQLLTELKEHPERFSPNVILRPVFQEWILPDIAFIGGGGEIAYWLQLKKVFEAAQVPYPILILRNSFLFITSDIQALVNKLQLDHSVLFQAEQPIFNQLVKRESTLQLSLENEKAQLNAVYDQLKKIAGNIDITLQGHTEALQIKALKKIAELEKKMLRAEKRKFEAAQRKLQKIKAALFPNNSLQERVDNLMPYYAVWGKEFIRMIYDHSNGLDQEFVIVTEKSAVAVSNG